MKIKSEKRLAMEDSPGDEPLENEATGERAGILFRLTVVSTGVLVVTILALAATQAGDPEAPASRWLGRYGGLLLTCETILCLLFGGVALAADRRRIVERQQPVGDTGDGKSTGETTEDIQAEESEPSR